MFPIMGRGQGPGGSLRPWFDAVSLGRKIERRRGRNREKNRKK
jgi:hypothetical protein